MNVKFYKLIALIWLSAGLLSCDYKDKPDHIQEVVITHTSPDTLMLYIVLSNDQDSAIAAEGHCYYDIVEHTTHLYSGDKVIKAADFDLYALNYDYPNEKVRALRIGPITEKDFKEYAASPSQQRRYRQPELAEVTALIDFTTNEEKKLAGEGKLLTKHDPL